MHPRSTPALCQWMLAANHITYLVYNVKMD